MVKYCDPSGEEGGKPPIKKVFMAGSARKVID
jgi:hypothetical protein